MSNRTVRGALKDILNKGSEVGSFEVFFSALRAAGLAAKLGRNGPFTVFVPTDEAFAGLEESTLQDWHAPEGGPELRAVLNYHVLPDRLLANDLIKSSSVKTVQGTNLTIRFTENTIHVNNATVLLADVECDDGVIHVLDTVVVPR